MLHQPEIHSENSPTEWALSSDSTADIEDHWWDATQGEELCTAYFDHADGYASNYRHEDERVTVPVLTGIAVLGTFGSYTYFDRAAAETILSSETVQAIEERQYERVNGY